jgi:DNA replication protein DnaT
MAWMKIETNTPEKPEIRTVARQCRCSKAEAFMAFFRLWAYFDQHTADGFIPGLVHDDIDEIAGLTGIARVLELVRWLTFDQSGIVISNWDRHNGESAKKRALAQKRAQTFRANQRWKTPPGPPPTPRGAR